MRVSHHNLLNNLNDLSPFRNEYYLIGIVVFFDIATIYMESISIGREDVT